MTLSPARGGLTSRSRDPAGAWAPLPRGVLLRRLATGESTSRAGSLPAGERQRAAANSRVAAACDSNSFSLVSFQIKHFISFS